MNPTNKYLQIRLTTQHRQNANTTQQLQTQNGEG